MVAEGREGENPLPFSLKGWGGGGWGVSRLRFPPGPHLRSSRFSRHPRLRQAPARRFGPGDLAHRFWGLDPATLTDFLQAKFLTSCCVSNPWVRVSKRYLAELYSSMRGGFPSSLQHFSRWAGPQAPGHLANKPLSPASRSRIPKMPRCSSAHEKPGLLHRLISCAQSLQPSLTFLLRRNNKVQGARS